jgi:ribonuclease G
VSSCKGSGKIEASVLITDEIERSLAALQSIGKTTSLTMLVHPMLEAYLKRGMFNSILKGWRKKYGYKISIDSSTTLELLEVHYYDQNQEEVELDSSNKQT